MKKSLLCGLFCLSVGGLAFADSAQFPCPNPQNSEIGFSPNMAILYAPLPTPGMPANLLGPGLGEGQGGDVAWDGMIIGGQLKDAQSTTITFSVVYLPSTNGKIYNVECIYNLTGIDAKTGQPLSIPEVILTPGNSNFLSMYNYSLNNGQNNSSDISTKIIASDINK